MTSKYQATVPADVRAALGVKAGDQLGWEVREGIATVRRLAGADLPGMITLVDSRTFGEWLNDEDEDLFDKL